MRHKYDKLCIICFVLFTPKLVSMDFDRFHIAVLFFCFFFNHYLSSRIVFGSRLNYINIMIIIIRRNGILGVCVYIKSSAPCGGDHIIILETPSDRIIIILVMLSWSAGAIAARLFGQSSGDKTDEKQ